MHQIQRVTPTEFNTAAFEAIAAEAAKLDGRSPLNEAVQLRLRHHGLAEADLWLAEQGFALVTRPLGAEAVTHAPAELTLAVAPEARGAGLGAALAEQALGEQAPAATAGPVSAWSHGNHPAAAAIATRLGFDRVRDLWVMRRPDTAPLPPLPSPGPSDGVLVRTFEPGRDESAVLDVNAAAFAHHPEQGEMTAADLDQRMAEDWFDPAGLFLAVRESPGGAEEVLGFHWTKVHRAEPPFGEVYVVGVAPSAQGTGVGRLLTLTGLHHLHGLGLGEVILYVEGDNEAATRMYDGLGFTHAARDTDVMYLR